MDETEIIPIQIPCALYEKKIITLIEVLLQVDEKLFPNEIGPEVRAECPKEVA